MGFFFFVSSLGVWLYIIPVCGVIKNYLHCLE